MPSASDDESSEAKPEKQPEHKKSKQPAARKEVAKPSQRTVATWRRGDVDMEPSAKMLALVEQLSIAHDAGEKTIVYSQCDKIVFFVGGQGN
jgi:hypothetical protein